AVWEVATEIAKAGGFDEANALVFETTGNEPRVLAEIAKASAKGAFLKRNERLLDQARDLAGKLSEPSRSEALREVCDEMAKLARITNNKEMLGRAETLETSVDWKDNPFEKWVVEALLGH